MRKWNLKNGDPLNLVIAADARLCKPDYRNDQIWEITLGRRDPPALEVETSFGMRVARMSLFPGDPLLLPNGHRSGFLLCISRF